MCVPLKTLAACTDVRRACIPGTRLHDGTRATARADRGRRRLRRQRARTAAGRPSGQGRARAVHLGRVVVRARRAVRPEARDLLDLREVDGLVVAAAEAGVKALVDCGVGELLARGGHNLDALSVDVVPAARSEDDVTWLRRAGLLCCGVVPPAMRSSATAWHARTSRTQRPPSVARTQHAAGARRAHLARNVKPPKSWSASLVSKRPFAAFSYCASPESEKSAALAEKSCWRAVLMSKYSSHLHAQTRGRSLGGAPRARATRAAHVQAITTTLRRQAPACRGHSKCMLPCSNNEHAKAGHRPRAVAPCSPRPRAGMHAAAAAAPHGTHAPAAAQRTARAQRRQRPAGSAHGPIVPVALHATPTQLSTAGDREHVSF
jgi:hypothetical protein